MHDATTHDTAQYAADTAYVADLMQLDPIAAMATVLHAAERATTQPDLFADPDEVGEVERAIEVTRELIAKQIGAGALLQARSGLI